MHRIMEHLKWKTISAFLAAGISIFLLVKITFENSSFFINPSYTALRAETGSAVTSDQHKKQMVFADRDVIGPWEKFTVKKNPDGSVILYDYYGHPLGRDKEQYIQGQSKNTGTPERFFLESSADSLRIRDQEGGYWQVTPEGRIRAGLSGDASAFSAIPVFVVIPLHHYLLCIFGLALLVAALVVFQMMKKPGIGIALLMTGGFLLALYAMILYNFLGVWDEQYHALVAKNMISDPFKPMLYTDPVLPYDFKNWTSNHVWLHKQPFFMWQMALSIVLFGPTVFAARIPDLVMFTMMVWLVYRMGSLLAGNRTGFWAAFLYTGSHFMFRLISGAQYTDHNDVAFIFYVTASTWAWLEYEYSDTSRRRLFFLILTGLLAGIAILIKWLAGLLVFAGWGLLVLTVKEKRNSWKQWSELLFSVLICFAVFLPWQIYILHRFPTESMHEFSMGASHFTHAIEGHSGDGLGWKYHIERFGANFGIGRTWWLLSVIPFFYLTRRKSVGFAVLFMVLLVFLFFSLAATKMPAFTLIAIALIFIIFASLLTAFERMITEMIPNRFFRILLFTSTLLFIFTGIFKLNEKYTSLYITEDDHFSYPYQREIYADWFREFIQTLPAEEQKCMVVLNCPWEQAVHMMYLTDVRAAYFNADSLDLSILKSRKNLVIGYLVYPDEAVPSEIAADDSILKIQVGKGITTATTGAYSK